MTINTFGRHFREGGKNIIRNGWMTFASVSSISISLFILGLFLILSLNVNYLTEQIEKQVEIRVFLELEITPEEISAIEASIAGMPEVAKNTFISKEEGLEILREKMGDSAEAYLDGLDGENNPLNDSFTVEVKQPSEVGLVAEKIGALNAGKDPAPIVDVNYGKGTVDTLFKVTSIIRNVGLVLVACLALTAMFLISNTIKLTIMARNREIKIMKLVGATNSFINWPFFIEGALLGLIGSAIPIGILAYGYFELLKGTQADISVFMVQFKPLVDVIYPVGILLLSIGLVIGIWGSLISVRKYLKV
ncbi:permease-like cell division protein FtsX [Paenibacillus sp. J2TS4]|uniref:permease-like cell division protein FtsX n=1 Tax=Paenibacillus sp. J2TS4 TaxID=2807194 RepID=UPI001B0AE564|nr:permease-like cell division protein FtsX [Paenibacillus sp. J2TS4]GIP35632.1 cell division protein FtsX [Paenibacillus sp. J2TS4]